MTEEVAAVETVKDDEIVADEVETVDPVEADAKPEETEETDNGEAQAKDTESKPSDSSTEKKKDGETKRIDELTKDKHVITRDRDYWKGLAEAKQLEPVAKVEPGRTLESFGYDEKEYATYVGDLAKADARAEVDRSIAMDKHARTQAEFNGKESDFSKDVDDYYVSTRSNDLRITNEMLRVMQGSDKGAPTFYYLSKNPEEASRLAAMDPLDMAREMGRIEATKLVKSKSPTETKAPKPVPKIAATDAKVTISMSDPKLTDAQFRKMREKQIANR